MKGSVWRLVNQTAKRASGRLKLNASTRATATRGVHGHGDPTGEQPSCHGATEGPRSPLPEGRGQQSLAKEGEPLCWRRVSGSILKRANQRFSMGAPPCVLPLAHRAQAPARANQDIADEGAQQCKHQGAQQGAVGTVSNTDTSQAQVKVISMCWEVAPATGSPPDRRHKTAVAWSGVGEPDQGHREGQVDPAGDGAASGQQHLAGEGTQAMKRPTAQAPAAERRLRYQRLASSSSCQRVAVLVFLEGRGRVASAV